MGAGIFIGCGIFVGFAMILEQICHAIVLTVTGDVIRDNIWLYAIYGGLAAALFEECGRWIAMKFCLKNILPGKCIDVRRRTWRH